MALVALRPRAVNSSSDTNVHDVATGPEMDDKGIAAAAIVAKRYRLSPCIARLVCFLADIGGRFS